MQEYVVLTLCSHVNADLYAWLPLCAFNGEKIGLTIPVIKESLCMGICEQFSFCFCSGLHSQFNLWPYRFVPVYVSKWLMYQHSASHSNKNYWTEKIIISFCEQIFCVTTKNMFVYQSNSYAFELTRVVSSLLLYVKRCLFWSTKINGTFSSLSHIPVWCFASGYRRVLY